jgi:hypothetical protein
MLDAQALSVRRCTAGQGMTSGDSMKKLMVIVAAAGAGFALWRKVEADKAEQALWAEVTDPVK